MTMTADPRQSNDDVRAELNDWVRALNATVATLYSEIERIRSGGLKVEGDPGAAVAEADGDGRRPVDPG